MGKNSTLRVAALVILALACAARGAAQERPARVRISNATLSYTALPLVAAREWGFFSANGLNAEIIVMASSVAAAALVTGDIDYVAGVGPASVSATLSGLPSRAMWFAMDKTAYWLMARSPYQTLASLKSRKVGVSGFGGTTHVSLLMALERLGVNPKDYVMVSLPGQQLLQSLETGFIDAASLPPPLMFSAQKKGFTRVLDIGATVDMPSGGLTALVKTLQERPLEVKRVIRSLQQAKEAIRKSKDRTVELIVRVLKMDRAAASETYDLFLTMLNGPGVPTRAGMANLVKAIQSQGRFVDRQISFSDIADDRLAAEVAREMGYKVP